MSQGITELQKKNLTVFKHMSEAVFRALVEALNDMDGHQGNGIAFHKTIRYPMGSPAREDIDLPTFDYVDGLLRGLNEKQVTYFDEPRSEHAYYLLLVGAPTENTLIDAVSKFRPKCLMIGVGDTHQFAHTLDTIDWGRHIADFQESGGTVYLIAETDPVQIVENAWRTCRTHNPTQIDNFTAIIQGDQKTQTEVSQHIAHTLMLSITQLGFFHDECVMLWNAYKNRKSGKVSVFRRAQATIDGVPAFVIASGPSLEHDLDTIKRHQGNVVVISIASALRPLLDAGIRPDFHVELENVYITPKLIELSKDHELDGIQLVAAATVEPDVLNYFNHAILYSREALSAYPLFSSGVEETLPLPGPTAGNAALSFALESGFAEVYLFGLDLGTRDPTRHHTRGSYYDTDDAMAHPDEYNIPIPGNFTEQVWTSRAFLSALKNADDLAAKYSERARIINCSDGALLRNAKPILAAKITPNFNAEKSAVIQTLSKRFDRIAAKDMRWPRDVFCKATGALFTELRACLTDPEQIQSGEYEARLLDILKLETGYRDQPVLGADMAALMMMRGTIIAMTLFMERYRSRVSSDSLIEAFSDAAVRQYAIQLNELEKTTMQLFDNPEPGQPPPVEDRIASADRMFPAKLRVPRNADCPCGSGQKFKRCHGRGGRV